MRNESGEADDTAAQKGSGCAGEATPAEPLSEHVEEIADCSERREIPIGTPVHPDVLRELKKRADTHSADAEPDAQADNEDRNNERTERHGDHAGH